jgi:hypothetical protein
MGQLLQHAAQPQPLRRQRQKHVPLLSRLSLRRFTICSWGDNNNQRFNLRINDKLYLANNVSLTSDIAYNRQDQVRPSQLRSVLSSSTPQPGLPASTLDGKPYAWGSWMAPNWVAELGGDNKLKVSAINISENFNWDITKHFNFAAR